MTARHDTSTRLDRKSVLRVCQFLMKNKKELTGQTYADVLQIITADTGIRIKRSQLKSFVSDMDVAIKLTDPVRPRQSPQRGEDRCVVLAEAILEIDDVLVELGRGLNKDIQEKVLQVRNRTRVDHLPIGQLNGNGLFDQQKLDLSRSSGS